MNKQNPKDGDTGPDNNPWQTLAETMEHPGFSIEQLPELWQQVAKPGDDAAEAVAAWNKGIHTMLRCCETYVQYTKLNTVLYGLPQAAWHDIGWDPNQTHNLLRQASPEQILQTLAYEQQQTTIRWPVSSQLVAWAKPEQLTGPIIEQLNWDSELAAWATTLGAGNTIHDRWQHIIEHVQQTLLDGDSNAWTIFRGIATTGTRISDIVKLVKAIETKQHLSVRLSRS